MVAGVPSSRRLTGRPDVARSADRPADPAPGRTSVTATAAPSGDDLAPMPADWGHGVMRSCDDLRT
ncbi:hypothetical protein ASG53_08115 [Sanguibacter sp. Leaf3]|nr:hypothetical protein ASG53_08115 [Sanguibacter sp. Leaf3]